ncbi:pH-sensitive chloride channel 2 [Cylas formicarius]|uniref:pH-sensitive chloride channel 2 n=1 Tax=Cylas formicarius TaxID=197179 RepID=UPI00295856B3|nr:pH-sensitive chloride channel 2 [Cylas formicarius]
MELVVAVCFLIMWHVARASNSTECPALEGPLDHLTQDELLSKLTAACRYDRLVKPPTEDPLRVELQINIKYIESVDNLQFKAHVLVQIRFRDERLRYDRLSPNRANLIGQETLRKKIWVPHLVVKNEKNSNLMGLDKSDMSVIISPRGEIFYTYRMTTTFYCWMNLRKFPFDVQVCEIEWISWSYNESHVDLSWTKKDPYFISDNLHLTEFSMDEKWITRGSVRSPVSESEGSSSSALVFHFRLRRESGYYILEYYLPSVLLVIMSWVSFWIQADAAPARVTLGTATMLSLISLNGNVSKNLPKVSYVKASEVWFFGGSAFIFCSLAEFAFVNVIWRRRKKVELIKQSSKNILKGALSPRLARKDLRKSESFSSLDSKHSPVGQGSSTSLHVPGAHPEESGPPTPAWTEMTPHEIAIWIDRRSRVVFPAAFLVCNLIYWSLICIL